MIKLRLSQADWKPSDDFILETNALDIAKSSRNYSVTAGPGAGKTELLAQRACFLLQTNVCTEPRRILAISFKKDAAKNIANRVKMRCGDELSERFVSLTYASFAKEILDHFRKALPEEYRPSQEYEIMSHNGAITDRFLGSFDSHSNLNISTEEIRNLPKHLTINKLPLNHGANWDLNEVILKIWERCVNSDSEESKLTFSMITRLSEFLIRENKKIHNSLIATYSHVFLDEFQDTTTDQYDLINTCFLGTNTILTAVGDKKQRIMMWAGADVNVFEKFNIDFQAEPCELMMNYRSAPRLVEIQKILIENMSEDNNNISAHNRWSNDDGICEIWNFENNQSEAEILSAKINQWILEDSLNPEDICILVKQRPDTYYELLASKLDIYGVKIRNESLLQDLISEECVNILLEIILCAFSKSSIQEWTNTRNLLRLTRFISPEESDFRRIQKVDDEFDLKIENIIDLLEKVSTKIELRIVLHDIIDFFGKENLFNLYPQYKQGTFFNQKINDLSEYLWNEYLLYNDWAESVYSLQGKDAISLMTIHKSKGLEYNTVIFLGLDDEQFWTFRRQPEEDTCAFFVALSRAKERAIFTFCKRRNNGRSINRSNISSLYSMLEESGIVETRTF